MAVYSKRNNFADICHYSTNRGLVKIECVNLASLRFNTLACQTKERTKSEAPDIVNRQTTRDLLRVWNSFMIVACIMYPVRLTSSAKVINAYGVTCSHPWAKYQTLNDLMTFLSEITLIKASALILNPHSYSSQNELRIWWRVKLRFLIITFSDNSCMDFKQIIPLL